MLKRFDKSKQWEEVEEYRALLEAPDRFDNGFTLRTILGVLFISLIMTPGEMYLGSSPAVRSVRQPSGLPSSSFSRWQSDPSHR